MAKTRYDERTLKMMEDFMDLHSQGLTIAEIAVKSQVSVWTIYGHLDEIAEKNHISRDSLLQIIRSTTVYDYTGTREKLVRIDVEAFQEKVNTVIRDIDTLIKNIRMIEEEE